MPEDDDLPTTDERKRAERRTVDRRGLLKTTGMALAGLTVPASAAAAQSSRSQGVDPSDPDSVIAFLERLDDASKDEAREMWTSLSEEKAEALAQAIDELSESKGGQATLVAKDGDGNVIARKTGAPETVDASAVSSAAAVEPGIQIRSLSFDDPSVAAQAEEYSYTDYDQRVAGLVVTYTMYATLTWSVPTTGQAYPMGADSWGNGKMTYWADVGEVTNTTSTQGSYAQGTLERRYKHANPATTSYYTYRMVLQGNPAGTGYTVTADPDA